MYLSINPTIVAAIALNYLLYALSMYDNGIVGRGVPLMHSQKGHNLYYDGSDPYLKFTYPGVNILSHLLKVQLRKVAHATQTFFSSDTLLRMCHNASSTTVSLSVFISLYVRLFQRLAVAYGKALNAFFSVSSILPMVCPNYAGVL